MATITDDADDEVDNYEPDCHQRRDGDDKSVV
jgi:hypothetical protein